MVSGMSFATMMVHVDAERDSSDRVSLAVDLASRFHSALIGIGGWSPGMGFAADVAVIDAEPITHQTNELMALMTAAESKFRTAASDIGHTEWRGELRIPINFLVREARAADLLIVGMQAAEETHCLSIDPGAAILRMGRPVLAVPNGIDSLSARRVVIAWKDCREARRAVRDALPILQEADEVLLAEVSEGRVKEDAIKGLSDVADYLQRQRVGVTAKAFLRRQDTVAADLIRFAQNEKSDLLVAGAYGHSRLGEWFFGGVTRDLLAGSPICCLFSH
jgi:nucleotide-binding universal stress UspA family protein